MGAGDPVGTPVVTKNVIFVSLSFSRKAEAWDVQFIVDLTSLQLEGSIWGQITPGDHLSIVQLRIFPRMSQAKQVDTKVQVNKI